MQTSTCYWLKNLKESDYTNAYKSSEIKKFLNV